MGSSKPSSCWPVIGNALEEAAQKSAHWLALMVMYLLLLLLLSSSSSLALKLAELHWVA